MRLSSKIFSEVPPELMKFEIPPFGAAVIFTVLVMGGLGMFVLIPIACIQWTWNALITQVPTVPIINVWQASLLYLAFALALYLTGWVNIEFTTENFD